MNADEIRNQIAKVSSRRYTGNDYEEFINEEGRKLRRKIDIPDPAYGDGHKELQELTVNVISLNDDQLRLDYLSSLEVDLDYYTQIQETISKMLGYGLTQFERQAIRIEKEIEKIAASIGSATSSEQLHYHSSLKEVEVVVKNVYDELIKYLSRNPKALYTIRPRQFEELIAEILYSKGWEIELTPETKDGGYDILAIAKNVSDLSFRTSYIIECKKYAPERKVGVQVVRQLLQVKNETTASNCMIVTSSDFTKGVYDYEAKRLDFDTKNFNAIIEWCKNYHPKS